MTDQDFESLRTIVLAELDHLDPHLTYHSKGHTIDVIRQSVRIATAEGVGEEEQLLLKFAALFHDTGFLKTYANHEVVGCEIFMQHTGHLNFTAAQQEIIKGLIMATRIPQNPQTHLQEIICDADLDYLGRDDFFTIGARLKKEFLHYGIVSDEKAWEGLQLNFLKNHRYHTASSQQLREPIKQQHYSTLI